MKKRLIGLGMIITPFVVYLIYAGWTQGMDKVLRIIKALGTIVGVGILFLLLVGGIMLLIMGDNVDAYMDD